MRYKLEDVGGAPRKLSKSTPRECLQRSSYVMARLLKPGDTISGAKITERLIDEKDGEIVFVLEDGSYASTGALDGLDAK